MTFPSRTPDPILRIYLSLAQYPILRTRIRARMRRELFARGVITPQAFEAEVREHAISSQIREGMSDPLSEEPVDQWEDRLARIRSHLTDFFFASNLPYELFEQLVRQVLSERGAVSDDTLVEFNPELAPQNLLFDQAFAIERMSDRERRRFEARLREIRVVLIRTMISDQLAYVSIAKDWFTISDLDQIRQRKIGYGKIGGKAAGMLLAYRILKERAEEEIARCLDVPESYYLGADLMYTFMSYNSLMHWNDQKYKPEEEIRADYPQIQREYLAGEFPADILQKLMEILHVVGRKPLIVRSSSLLEDNFGTSFAGKYDSYFCPNQGSPQENLEALTEAIIRVYASSVNPDALLYRRSKRLQDYDERMAILIQVVEGERFGRYFFPQVSGVAFSKNLYRWSPQIRREDGFLRLVWGLGTRAVDRVGNDYPRLVALSHPQLRPEADPKVTHRYSQHDVDVIDLADNTVRTLPIEEVLAPNYNGLRFLAEIYEDGFLRPIRTRVRSDQVDQLVLTFDGMLKRTRLADRMRTILAILEEHYQLPVDMEFTVRMQKPGTPESEVEITVLQCRPLSELQDTEVQLPKDLPEERIIFATRRIVPHGQVDGIRWVVFVPPEGYFALSSQEQRVSLRRAIGGLNAALEGDAFICVGPGRWGTNNPELGVHVGYADIYNARALVEVSGEGVGTAPDPSFGTHFFQDLIEAHIYPLALFLDDEDSIFNRAFFYDTPNQLARHLPDHADLTDSLRLIDVESFRANHRLSLVMDDERGQAVAYLVPEEDS